MNKKILKKEGLILLGFILSGVIIVLLSNFQLRHIISFDDILKPQSQAQSNPFDSIPVPSKDNSDDPFAQPVQSVSAGSGDIFDQVSAQDATQKLKILRNIGFILIFLGYPAYYLTKCIFRFVIWAGKLFLATPVRYKQKIVLWIMGILICGIFLFVPKLYTLSGVNGRVFYFNSPADNALPILRWDIIAPACVTVLIIGGLLIYSLREKK